MRSTKKLTIQTRMVYQTKYKVLNLGKVLFKKMRQSMLVNKYLDPGPNCRHKAP